MKGWIGVDLDGTLANTEQIGPDGIGIPVPLMLARVKAWIEQGIEVRIFTARAVWPAQKPLIQAWCQRHLGLILPVTNVKTPEMLQLWDDRAVGVRPNTGEIAPKGWNS